MPPPGAVPPTRRVRVVPLALLLLVPGALALRAAIPDARPAALVLVRDEIAAAGEGAPIEVQLRRRGIAGVAVPGRHPLEGHRISLEVGSRPVEVPPTDRRGIAAAADFRAPGPGVYVVAAWLPPSERLRGARGEARLFVPPPGRPLLLCELEQTLIPVSLDAFLSRREDRIPPDPAKAQALRAAAERRAVAYLAPANTPPGFAARARAWLAREGFPDGPILEFPPAGSPAASGRDRRQEIRSLAARFPVDAAVTALPAEARFLAAVPVPTFLLGGAGRRPPPGVRPLGSLADLLPALGP